MRPKRVWRASAVIALILNAPCASAADASTHSASQATDFTFLLELALLILVGRLLGEAMQRIGQPAVIGQLLGGLLLGPSVFGALWPDAQHMIFPREPVQKAMIDAVAQLGVLLLLLLAGMETDLRLVRKVGRPAAAISIAGIALPFACGYALGELMPDSMLPDANRRMLTSLFLGTALSISSVKIVAMVVREMNFTRRNLGQLILAAAVIDDTIGWLIIALTFSLASRGEVDAVSLTQSFVGTLAFLAIAFTAGRRIVFSMIRWANDNLRGEAPVISLIVLIMAALAMATHAIGVHTVLGAFVAGILVGGSPILTRSIDMQLRGLIAGLFMPVFFGLAGLSADLTILKSPRLLLFTAGLVVIASIGKFAGAYVGGMFGRLSARESLALGCGMNARGSTEVIVASIGLSMGVLDQDLFTMIVTMAIVTTMAMPPMLRAALQRLPISAEEQNRLDREAFESRGFVSNLERVLLAVDDSPNAKFASRIAGLIAGAKGMPTTVLHLDSAPTAADSKNAESPESHLKAGAKAGAAREEKSRDAPAKVDVLTRAAATPPAEAVATEAVKGYDLMIVGVDMQANPLTDFGQHVTDAANGFTGPLAIVAARGRHLQRPKDAPFRILVPVTGAEASRRAAEVAVALARSIDAPIGALYVSGPAPSGAQTVNRAFATRRHEERILKDFAELAERNDTEARTAVRVNTPPEDAILMHARTGRFDLIVLGVNRRPGDALYFGHVATAVLERADVSVLLVAGGVPAAANPAT